MGMGRVVVMGRLSLRSFLHDHHHQFHSRRWLEGTVRIIYSFLLSVRFTCHLIRSPHFARITQRKMACDTLLSTIGPNRRWGEWVGRSGSRKWTSSLPSGHGDKGPVTAVISIIILSAAEGKGLIIFLSYRLLSLQKTVSRSLPFTERRSDQEAYIGWQWIIGLERWKLDSWPFRLGAGDPGPSHCCWGNGNERDLMVHILLATFDRRERSLFAYRIWFFFLGLMGLLRLLPQVP